MRKFKVGDKFTLTEDITIQGADYKAGVEYTVEVADVGYDDDVSYAISPGTGVYDQWHNYHSILERDGFGPLIVPHLPRSYETIQIQALSEAAEFLHLNLDPNLIALAKRLEQ